MGKFGTGQKRLAGIGLLFCWFGLVLGACGDASPTVSPTTAATTAAPSTIAATTAAATPTVAAATALATTAAVTTVAATTTAASGTTLPPFVATATAKAKEAALNPPTPTIPVTQVGPQIPPTFTVGPTPAYQPPAKGWWSNGVCYEIFVRSFYDSNGDGIGDLPGLISKLDYIKNLGATCIWLMPVQQSPSYHGYDQTDYYTVNKDYGTNDDFKKLMTEAHNRGIYVLIDWVINHTSNQHPWFIESQNPASPKRNWYIWTDNDLGYTGPWGDKAWWPLNGQYYYGVFDKSQPDLNFRNPDVTKEIYNATRFWLQDMGVDGFRLDAARHLIEDGRSQAGTPETRAWLRDWEKYVKSVKPDAFTVGEINGPSLELNGYWPDQLDSYFEFGIADSTLKSVIADKPGGFLAAVNYSYTNWPFERWSSFLTNHDQNRVMSQLQGDMSRMKLTATMLLTSPGLPFLYYGEELGAGGSKPDENIRTPMQWENNPANAGFTTGKPWRAPDASVTIANVAAEDKDPNSLLNYYRKLIKLRRESTALSGGSWTALTSDKASVGAYIRQSADETVLVVLNLDPNPVDNASLSAEKSGLKDGQFGGQELLQAAKPADLTVEAGGAIKGYVPLPKMEGRTAYIIKLTGK